LNKNLSTKKMKEKFLSLFILLQRDI